MMDGARLPVRHPFDTPPGQGEAIEVAPGILWLRLPLPMQLDHVNCYALDDGDGWTVIDTGFDTGKARGIWQALLDGPMAGRPVRRIVLTHHHPDHIGLAGWFRERGAEVVATRTAWTTGRMLVLDVTEEYGAESLAFFRAAGMAPDVYEEHLKRRPYNYADVVAPIPPGYLRLREGDRIRMGGRDWLVRCGDGHAPEHATFWSLDDDLVIGGDQLLPGISANIGIWPTEPDADPLGEWLESCARFSTVAEERHFVLPGHKLPYYGLPTRLDQMVSGHEKALERLLDKLTEPRTAGECFLPVFGREIGGPAYNMAMVESLAHLRHLLTRGLVRRHRREDGAWLWQRI